MKKYFYSVLIIISVSISSLCLAKFDTVVVLTNDRHDAVNQIIEGSDGSIYGTSSIGAGEFGGGSIFKIKKDGSGFQVLHSFNSGPSDGIEPLDRVIEGSDGMLYGTTKGGGQYGKGTIFKINKDGSGYTVLFEFSINNIGVHPTASLLEASDGKLYGTTTNYNRASDCDFNACDTNGALGSVFKINKDGTDFTTLFLFQNADFDLGQILDSRLVEGDDGYLYGTTARHLFKITKDGNDIKSLHLFSGGLNGGGPEGALINNNGTLYGVTKAGGASNFGTVYKINEDGTNFTLLWSFVNNSHFPNSPFSGVVLDNTGVLYGVANHLAYKLNTDGTGFEIISSPEGNLAFSFSELIQASDGALYGAIFRGMFCRGISYGGVYSLRDSVETIFNWAEITFPQYFPTEEITQISGPWLFRYYPLTGIYVGVNNDDNGIYVLGGAFGGTPLFINSKKAILAQAIGINAILCE